jgi:glutathione S-transferase
MRSAMNRVINSSGLFTHGPGPNDRGMKNRLELFATPKVCSLVPHIVLRELALDFDLTFVDLKTKMTAKGEDFSQVHPLAYVPALRLEDGEILRETATILRYLADRHPERGLVPAPGTRERLRLDELLNFVATELHKGVAPFTIMRQPSEESKTWAAERLVARLDVLEQQLGDRTYFIGDQFTIADAYVFWAARNAAHFTKRPLPPRLAAFVARIGERPSVLAAEEAERRRG